MIREKDMPKTDVNSNRKDLFRPYALPDKKTEPKTISVAESVGAGSPYGHSMLRAGVDSPDTSPGSDYRDSSILNGRMTMYSSDSDSPGSSPGEYSDSTRIPPISAFSPTKFTRYHLGVGCHQYVQGMRNDFLKLPNVFGNYYRDAMVSPQQGVANQLTQCCNIAPNAAIRALFNNTHDHYSAKMAQIQQMVGNQHGRVLAPVTDNISPASALCVTNRVHPDWAASVRNHNGSHEPSPTKPPHAGPPRYQCDGCSKSYATFGGLSKHKQFHCVSHVKKEFSCKSCDKTYSSLGALKMHIRTHTLPCKCKLCGKAFSRPWLLQGHVRTHTGEKPFHCQHCGRAFADRSNLRAHLQTHSEVKKYGCKLCAKTFSRMSLLLKHSENSCPRLMR